MSLAPTSETDRLVGGRYRLRAQLGRGGAGVVWVAEDELLGREVAVKEFLLPTGVGVEDRATMLARVLREARAAARLHDPSLVTVYDVVREDEQPWIVMEYVPGRSLAEVVREDGPLSPARTAEIGLALLHALRTAHSNGVLHRDVKPANVLLDESGRVLLTDFGIAFTEGDPSLTSTGILLGSPAYMPPERARGERATPASDLWSLGATLYTLVEGEPPYSGENSLAVLVAVADNRRRPMERAGALAPVLADLLDQPSHERPDPDELDDRLRAAARSTTPAPAPALPLALAGGTRPERVGERTTVLAALPVVDAGATGGADAIAAAGPVTAPSPVTPAADADRREPPPVPPRRVEPRRVPPRPAGFVAEQGRSNRRLAAGLLGAAAVVGALVVAAVVSLGGSGAGSTTRQGTSPAPTGAPPAGAGLAASPAPSSARASAAPSGSASPSATPSRSASPPPSRSASPSSPPTASATGSPAPSTPTSSAAIPAGWQSYTNSRYGWTIAHPAGWSVGSGITSDQIDLRDPATGRLLRVEIGAQPHLSAIQDWYSYEPAFARQVQGYQRIRISPSDGGSGNQSADWEFTFRSGSATLHALDRGVVDGRTPHALYWQTTDSDWAASQQQFGQLAASFVPPPQS